MVDDTGKLDGLDMRRAVETGQGMTRMGVEKGRRHG
jgi:hypothetical protein